MQSFTCKRCGKESEQRTGRGRPWSVCRQCKQTLGSNAYTRSATPCITCTTGTAHGGHTRCAGCRAKTRDTKLVTEAKTLIKKAKAKQRERAAWIYLEARCNTCQSAMWLDSHAVNRKQRHCSMYRCTQQRRRTSDNYRDALNIKNTRRRIAMMSGDAIKKSEVWARDAGTCHICAKPCDPNNWHQTIS